MRVSLTVVIMLVVDGGVCTVSGVAYGCCGGNCDGGSGGCGHGVGGDDWLHCAVKKFSRW